MAEIYVSTDVETDGPIPGPHSMLSFASAAYRADKKLIGTFSANLHLLPGATGHPETMAWWQGQPAASSVPEDYPADDALGNDDATDTDPENNDPYNNGGVVTATDDVIMSMADATGADGDTFERHYHFREFLRINLETRWYRVSDFSLWRFHGLFRREGGVWKDHGSVLARDNAGF